MSSHPGFYDLGIAPNIIAILDKLHFAAPMPIQEKCIPAAIEGKVKFVEYCDYVWVIGFIVSGIWGLLLNLAVLNLFPHPFVPCYTVKRI